MSAALTFLIDSGKKAMLNAINILSYITVVPECLG